MAGLHLELNPVHRGLALGRLACTTIWCHKACNGAQDYSLRASEQTVGCIPVDADMFNEATMTVKRHLDAVCRSLQELMEERADEIYIKMKADYMRVLGGVQISQATAMSRDERNMRSNIMDQLRAVDARFESISKGELAPADTATDLNNEDQSAATDDTETMASESAHESSEGIPAVAHNDSAMQDSIMRDNNDTYITEPMPITGKESALPTPSSNQASDAEL